MTYCVCGHASDDHALPGQMRIRLACEFPGCGCQNFRALNVETNRSGLWAAWTGDSPETVVAGIGETPEEAVTMYAEALAASESA